MTMGFSERVRTYQIGFIASRLYTILYRIEKGRSLHSKDLDAVVEGAELMSQIVSGSLLVENRDAHDGLAPSLEGIPALGSALSVLRILGSKIEEGGLSDLFLHFHRCLVNISHGESIQHTDISTLKSFFEMLSKLILDDIKREKIINSSQQLSFERLNGLLHHVAI